MEKVTKAQENYQNGQLSNAITTTLELEQNFKLFSFRIVDQKMFITQVDTLLKNYASRNKKLRDEYQSQQKSNQIDIEDAILAEANK